MEVLTQEKLNEILKSDVFQPIKEYGLFSIWRYDLDKITKAFEPYGVNLDFSPYKEDKEFNRQYARIVGMIEKETHLSTYFPGYLLNSHTGEDILMDTVMDNRWTGEYEKKLSGEALDAFIFEKMSITGAEGYTVETFPWEAYREELFHREVGDPAIAGTSFSGQAEKEEELDEI